MQELMQRMDRIASRAGELSRTLDRDRDRVRDQDRLMQQLCDGTQEPALVRNDAR